MNAPEQHELFTLPAGVKKITYIEDSRIQFAGTFTIHLEDHTVGNILRMQLLQDERVRFAGYKAPHPLEYKIEVKVQTNGQITPHQAVIEALQALSGTCKEVLRLFEAQLSHSG
jgi:DNA-directed RNA polymerase II subunit RPB11